MFPHTSNGEEEEAYAQDTIKCTYFAISQKLMLPWALALFNWFLVNAVLAKLGTYAKKKLKKVTLFLT